MACTCALGCLDCCAVLMEYQLCAPLVHSTALWSALLCLQEVQRQSQHCKTHRALVQAQRDCWQLQQDYLAPRAGSPHRAQQVQVGQLHTGTGQTCAQLPMLKCQADALRASVKGFAPA